MKKPKTKDARELAIWYEDTREQLAKGQDEKLRMSMYDYFILVVLATIIMGASYWYLLFLLVWERPRVLFLRWKKFMKDKRELDASYERMIKEIEEGKANG